MFKQMSMLCALAVLATACNKNIFQTLSKEKYTVSRDNGHEGNAKILKGSISRPTLETDTAFKWFVDNAKFGTADAAAAQIIAAKKDQIKFLVFGGTWCHDTQSLLPTFYKLMDKSNIPSSNIYLVGVDRAKTTIQNLHKTYNITNVPTFIVLHNGKEVGRVVEYGKTGNIEKELADIVSTIQ